MKVWRTLLATLVLAVVASAQEQPAILERKPTEWKVAAEGTWKDWSPEVEPPEVAQPHLIKSISAIRIGDMPTALEALYDLLDEVPDYPSALHQAGVIYFRLRRYGDAIVALERFLVVAPRFVGDTRALGHCYYTLGNYSAARAHYEKVLEVEPESVEARRGYALSFMREGDTAHALQELRRVLELEPRHADAATWIAQILYDEDRVEEALEAAELARDLDPYAPRAWYLLSQIYFELGRDEEGESASLRFSALNQIAQEIRAQEARLLYDPRQPAVYARLVELNRQAGDLLAVGRWLNRWLEVDPQRIELRILQLDLAIELKDEQAAAALAQNLELAAGDQLIAWERLARFHAQNRDRVRQAEAESRIAKLRAKQSGNQ